MQKRGLYWMLYSILNRPDASRIKAVGPDIACAEWLIRCSASPKFKSQSSYFTEWNQIPSSHTAKLEGAFAEDARIMPVGMAHFEGCKHMKELTVKGCKMFDDGCLISVARHLSSSLTHLSIETCDISEHGLKNIAELRTLQQLKLTNLLSVRNHDEALKTLKSALPNCEIMYT